jgi:hypothetical protein
MNLSRRQLFGAIALTSAGLMADRAMASAGLGAQNDLKARAMAALQTHAQHIPHRDVVGIVDFSLPSRLPRFQLLDMASGRTSTMLVSHGRGSDPANSGWLERFSNQPGSNASCNGSFVTGNTYVGKHGRSRKLIGLDPMNNLAEPRAIVIHQASYVSDAMARDHGRVGRSQGCFAVSSRDIDEVLARLGPGRLLFAAK